MTEAQTWAVIVVVLALLSIAMGLVVLKVRSLLRNLANEIRPLRSRP